MPKFRVWRDERWPDYGLEQHDEVDTNSGGAVELTDAEYEDWCRVNKEYDAWQTKVAKASGYE